MNYAHPELLVEPDWVATHANAAATPVREYYLVGRSDTSNDDELRTDICWPVQSH